jgi:nucleotide-binding universal stress UspA family protein
MKKVKELQTFFNATLHILLVNTPARFMADAEAKKLLEEFAHNNKLANFTLNFRNGRTEEAGILAFADEVKADLVAMATHGRKGLAHLVSGSIAEDVVNHITCPIWTCVAKI